MRDRIGSKIGMLAVLLIMAVAIPLAYASEFPRDAAARYILATAKAFRTVYAKQILSQAAKSSVKPG